MATRKDFRRRTQISPAAKVRSLSGEIKRTITLTVARRKAWLSRRSARASPEIDERDLREVWGCGVLLALGLLVSGCGPSPPLWDIFRVILTGALTLVMIGLVIACIATETRDSNRRAQEAHQREKQREAATLRRRQRLARERGAEEALSLEHEEELAEEIRRFKLFAHYSDPVWLEQYARAHTHQLLQSRADILRDDSRFHELNDELAANLTKYAPETYARRRWKVAALVIAEQLAVVPPKPPRSARIKKETREEYAARRARHEQHIGHVETARVVARLTVEKEAEERIAREFPELDEDERRQKVREIVEVYEGGGDGTKI